MAMDFVDNITTTNDKINFYLFEIFMINSITTFTILAATLSSK